MLHHQDVSIPLLNYPRLLRIPGPVPQREHVQGFQNLNSFGMHHVYSPLRGKMGWEKTARKSKKAEGETFRGQGRMLGTIHSFFGMSV